jgi:hypothetical protein
LALTAGRSESRPLAETARGLSRRGARVVGAILAHGEA